MIFTKLIQLAVCLV